MENEREGVIALLQSVARMLALIPTEALERHVSESGRSLSRAQSLGPILDPTAYRNALYGGELKDADNQFQIACHLLAARRAIDAREAFVAQKAIERAERDEG